MKKQKTIKQLETICDNCDKKIKSLNKKWDKIHTIFKDYNGYDFKFIKMKYKLDKICLKIDYYINLKKHCINKIYGIAEYEL